MLNSMKFKILKYVANNNHYDLSPHGLTAWMLEDDWNELLEAYPTYRDGMVEFYIKTECHNPLELTDFVLYTKLAKLPSQSRYLTEGRGYVWFPKELMPQRDNTTNKRSEVEISVMDISEVPIAESVTIRLREDDVETWSETEFEAAEKDFRKQVNLFCTQQKYFFNRSVKDAVVCDFTEVIPKPVSDSLPCRITSETEISVKGKPMNPQQVIDFSKIGGQKKVIDELRRMIQLPLNYPEYFAKFGVKPPKGVLLYGPPGNGKTMIARAVAQSFGAAFIEIDLSDALQKYKGVGEYNLGKKFEEAERKRNAVIFIDEIDSIASIREKDSQNHEISLVGKLLSLMDGIKSSHRVFVIGATNRLNAIDPALRRPGRFDKDLEVPQPDCESRYDILCKYVKWEDKTVFDDTVTDEFLMSLANLIEGFSGADISALYTETAMSAIRRQLQMDVNGKATMSKDVNDVRITKDDFKSAVSVIKSTEQRSIEVRNRSESDEI